MKTNKETTSLILNDDGSYSVVAIETKSGGDYKGLAPINVDNTKREIGIDLGNIASQDDLNSTNIYVSKFEIKTNEEIQANKLQLDNLDTVVGTNSGEINTIKTNFVDKTTTEKQFLAGDLNVKGKLQTTQKAEFNVDVLRLEDGNDLYVGKTGNSTFDTLIGNALSGATLLNREVIEPNANPKTATNKAYVDEQVKINADAIAKIVIKNSFNVRGVWTATDTYAILDLVFYDKPGGKEQYDIYVSRVDGNINLIPSDNQTQWAKIGSTNTIFASKEDFDNYVISNDLAMTLKADKTELTKYFDKTTTDEQSIIGATHFEEHISLKEGKGIFFGKLGTDPLVPAIDWSKTDNDLRIFLKDGDITLWKSSTVESGRGRLGGIRTPIEPGHASNKEYVDTNLALKQNTLIAGENITIEGDTINATGGANDWVLISNVNSTVDSDLNTKQEITLTKNVNQYSEFRIIGRGLSPNTGQFIMDFKVLTTSYGQGTNTNNYLSANTFGKTMKWVNVSGGGASGNVWLYLDFALQSIWGKKK